jgi:hypothetical protein
MPPTGAQIINVREGSYMSCSSGGRGLLRALVAGGVAAGMLVGAGPAPASLGDGTPATFSNRPNLKSVTFNGLVASFNFDRAVQPAGGAIAPGQFQVGGYRAGVAIPHSGSDTAFINLTDPTQVLVTYTGSPDFNSATFGAVEAGAIKGVGTFATPNLADATRITGASGENGTRGRTAGPDLQSVSVDSGQNRITYTFDQSVASGPTASSFRYYDVNGNVITGDSIVQVSGANVVVGFALPKSVLDARQAAVLGAGVKSKDGATFGPPAFSVTVPSRTATTATPVLTSAELEPGSGTVVFTYDAPVGTVNAAQFQLVTASGATFGGVSATIATTKTVRVTFGSVDLFTEHLVAVSDLGAAATGTSGRPSLPAGKAIGGNAGAKSTGYTSAPDALSATVNKATGQVSVVFDSRIALGGVAAANFVLVSADGLAIATAQGSPTVQQPIGAPATPRVILQYEPTQVAQAAALRVKGNGVTGGAFSTAAGDAAVLGTSPGALADAQPVDALIVPTDTTQTFSARR